MMKFISEIVGAIVTAVVAVPIVSWLVPSPEFSSYITPGVLLGALAGGVTHAYVGRRLISRLIMKLWPPALWLVIVIALWAFYKFAWQQEGLAATKGNGALVGFAVLLLAFLTSFGTALLASELSDRTQK